MTTRANLEGRLERAQRELVCADMIDSFARRDAETRRCRAVVAELERQLAALDDPINLQGSGPAPISPRED